MIQIRKNIVVPKINNRNSTQVCVAAVVTWAILSLILYYNWKISEDPWCTAEIVYEPWVKNINMLVSWSFVFVAVLQWSRIQLSIFRESNRVGTLANYYSSLSVNMIAGLSTILSYAFDFGGVCEDAFSVQMNAAHFPEWLVCVPLIAYTAASVDDKPNLSREEVVSLLCHFLCIAFGALAQASKDPLLCVIFLVLSSFCLVVTYSSLFEVSAEYERLQRIASRNSRSRGLFESQLVLARRKLVLTRVIGYMFPIFPLIYGLAMYGFIDDNTTFAAFLIFSASTKITFATACMDACMEVSHPSQAQQEAEEFAKDSRRAFLRYVFHEVRAPLNSISMGVDLLSKSTQMVDGDASTVLMVRDAAVLMADTLNDALTLHKIEEGSMEVGRQHFSITNLFNNIQTSVKTLLAKQSVELEMNISSDVPDNVIGDKFRLRHVLAHLVINAIRFSASDSRIFMRAEIDKDHHISVKSPAAFLASASVTSASQIYRVMFTVDDQGTGISSDRQTADIFSSYGKYLRSGMAAQSTKKKSSGLGLAACKEIVHLLEGDITYVSTVGVGTVFTLVIPLQLDKNVDKAMAHTRSIEANMAISSDDEEYGDSNNNSKKREIERMNSLSNGKVSVSRLLRKTCDILHLSSANLSDLDSSNSSSSDSLNSEFRSSNIRPLQASDRGSSADSGKNAWSLRSNPSENDDDDDDDDDDNSDGADEGKGGDRLAAGRGDNAEKANIRERNDGQRDAEEVSSETTSQPSALSINTAHSEAETLLPEGYGSSATAGRVDSSSSRGVGVGVGVGFQERSGDPFTTTTTTTTGIPTITTATSPAAATLSSSSSPPTTARIGTPGKKNRSAHAIKTLVVDDVLMNRKLLGMLLSNLGVKCADFAEDGKVALEKVQALGQNATETYDIIFMDNTMPVMTGIECTRTLRAWGYKKTIIALTGNTLDEELIEFARAGADLVLTKPFKVDTLKVIFRHVLDNGVQHNSTEKLIVKENCLVKVPCEQYFSPDFRIQRS
mmetsp:Transcript_26566/g.44412  ORF Transcript_26566/g.44412 Transcript_26566/m.44412 type:complete len:1010 (+) Transcript_26566:77-3106(+)